MLSCFPIQTLRPFKAMRSEQCPIVDTYVSVPPIIMYLEKAMLSICRMLPDAKCSDNQIWDDYLLPPPMSSLSNVWTGAVSLSRPFKKSSSRMNRYPTNVPPSFSTSCPAAAAEPPVVQRQPDCRGRHEEKLRVVPLTCSNNVVHN